MTADKSSSSQGQASSTSPSGSKSPRSPSRSQTVNSQYARAYQYHSFRDADKDAVPSTPTRTSGSGSGSAAGAGAGAGSPRTSSTSPQSPRRSLGHTSTHSHEHTHVRPAGPRSPDSKHHGPGSSRTRYHTTPLPATSNASQSATSSSPSQTRSSTLNIPTSPTSMRSDHTATHASPKSTITAELDSAQPHAPYRPPEPVIEPPEEHPPGYTPGIVAEHIEGDDELASSLANDPPLYQGELRDYMGDVKGSKDIDIWQEDVKTAAMDIDPSISDDIPRPQIGAGVLPRRLLMLIHEHELLQPQITQLPPVGKSSQAASSSTAGSASRWDGSNKALTSNRPLSVASSSSATNLAAPPSPSPSSASARSLPDVEHISSLDDVWEALPGGLRDHGEWYFCTTCWGWIRITGGTERLPTHLPWNERDKIYRSTREREKNEIDPEELEKLHTDWKREVAILEDLQVSREMSEETHHHFHEFESLPVSQPASRIPRVEVDERMNVFPHITFQLEADARWTSFGKPLTPTRRFISCSSDLWLQVDEGVIAGQLPVGLVRAFTDEKINNPSAGLSGVQSVNDAWNLIATLLSNPLFKGQRGWVKLDNPKFQKTIGASVISSNLLYQIGFACQQEADGLRVGPFKVGEEPSEEDRMKQKQMDQYMIRTWIEISMYLSALQKRNDLPPSSASFVQTRTLDECIKDVIELDFYPQPTQPYNDLVKRALYQLGATKQDRAQTIEIAYGLQIACDAQNTPLYLSALEKIAEAPTFGRESLQMRVATERSLNKYTIDDLQRAYDAIGYTSSHAEEICVMPHEAPEDYILNMHKKAVQAATSPNERWELSRALLLIGRERKSELMQRLGDSGQTLMSVEEAYAALSCPMDAVDDGLLMQYEMAVSEYPGKADHYRNCLSIIANAPGQERPGIKTFLETGSREPEAPARNDIPVGLHNIGNTCYLNSILQYLYSIKPLRDAVISFEQNLSAPAMPSKPDVDRSKRFVRQLRLLFLQLYKSELPSVRPDEELAYLAITRPEVDAIVEPELHASPEATATAKPSKLTLDSIPDIPDIPSPSSTQVATPASTPGAKNVNLPSTSALDPRGGSDVSVLGKRASEDRDDSSRSSLELEHVRHKSEGGDIVEGFERVARTQSPMEVDTDDFELIPKPDQAPSPSATMDLGHLDIKSPPPESDATAAGGSYAEDDYLASKGRQDTLKPPIPQQEEKFDPPSVPPPLPPRPNFAKKDTLSSGLRFGLQQDSAEVLINVLSQLELALDEPSSNDGEKGSNLIQRLFSCKYRQQIIYESPSSPSTSPSKSTPRYEAQTPVESVFVHPIIGVEEEGKDLSDCLAELYLKGADIEYEGKKGFMMDLMDEFPDMLYIQMRRSQYDPTTGRERKTNTHIPFNQTLSMGRFLVGADAKKREESIELTREMTRVRTRLHQLRNHKPLSIPQTFKHASAALRQLAASSDSDLHEVSADLNEDLFQALDAESTAVENEIAQLQDSLPRLKERMEAIWSADDDTSGSVGGGEEWDYELVSVFMHRGKNSGSGHYWTYQAHLPDHPETFFKYNDETVTAVPSSEVLQDRTGDDANPALLCYVRKGKNLIDTLHREILDRSVDQSQEQGGGEGARALIDI